jgi:hypothetical protein
MMLHNMWIILVDKLVKIHLDFNQLSLTGITHISFTIILINIIIKVKKYLQLIIRADININS